KTAATLLRRYADLEGILAAAADPESELSPRQRSALLDSGDYLAAARQVVRLGGREFDLEIDGDPDGRRGAVDDERIEAVASATGQARSIGRLVEATRLLEPVP